MFDTRGTRGSGILAARLSLGGRGVSVAQDLRHPLALYAALAVGGAGLLVLTIAPMASGVVERWSRRDLEIRSSLVFNSVRDRIAEGLAATAGGNLVPFFERLAGDERFLALGFCGEDGRLQYATKQMPRSVRCE